MATEKLRNIRKQLFRHGRYLDVARWNYHFEDGPYTDVLKALYAYRNTDGGFGYGLEPDNRNPGSTPVATWAAVEILRELDFPADAKNMMDRMISYLINTEYFDGLRWRATVPENDDYPHAPWWSYRKEDGFGYNPTAALAGFVLRFSEEGSTEQEVAYRVIEKMSQEIAKPEYSPESHELANFITLEEDLKAVGKENLLPNAFYENMHRWVFESIDHNKDVYRNDNYYTSPDRYIMSVNSPYYSQNADICDFYVGFIEDSVADDGTWPVNWRWGENPIPPDVLRDWRGSLAVSKMLFIQRMTFPPEDQ